MNKAEKFFLLVFIILANSMPNKGIEFGIALLILGFVGLIFILVENYEVK